MYEHCGQIDLSSSYVNAGGFPRQTRDFFFSTKVVISESSLG